MKKYLILGLFLAVFFASPSFAQTDNAALIAQLQAKIVELQEQLRVLLAQERGDFCHDFTHNLKLNDSGGDIGGGVERLWRALSLEGLFTTPTEAPGGFFDKTTFDAVVRFQEKYASEILMPHGLTRGTGYVGPATRAKLNQLYGCSFPPAATSTNINISLNTGLAIMCPSGVICNEDFDYRAFQYRDDRITLHFFFRPGLVNNYNLQSFRDNFNYVNINKLAFPELSSGRTEVYYQNNEPIRAGVAFTGYSAGRLSGKLTVPIRSLTYRTSDPSCVSGDIAGYCYEDRLDSRVLNVDFNLAVPN